jgi:hypothetical protein
MPHLGPRTPHLIGQDSQRGECRTTPFCFGDTNRWPLAQGTAIRFSTLFRHEAVIDYAWNGEQVLLEKSKKRDCIKAFSETDFWKISKSLDVPTLILPKNRTQFYKDITLPFYGYNRPGAARRPNSH